MRRLGTGVATASAAALLAIVAAASVGVAAAPEIRHWLEGQLAVQRANEAKAVKLGERQETVVRSMHDVVQEQLSTLKRRVDEPAERRAVDAARLALHAQAKAVHTKTQRTMTKVLQMLRRQINRTERKLEALGRAAPDRFTR